MKLSGFCALLIALALALALGSSKVAAQPFTLGTPEVDIALASGFNHANIPVAVIGGSGFDFSQLVVASDSPWVSPTVDATGGNVVLSFSTAALTNSSYTATITATSGANTGTFLVVAANAPLSVLNLTADPFRSRVYGVAVQGLNRGSVVVLDSVAGLPVANVTVGRKPTGMAVSNDGTELLVINAVDQSISVVDLTTLRLKQTITLNAYTNWGQSSTTASIAVGPGNIIYYTDGAWAPPLRVFDRSTSTVLQTVMIDPTSGYGFGGFALTHNKNQLFGWAQYGWSAGWAGSYISKFTVDASGLLTYVQSTNSTYPTTLNRDPLGTPVLVGSDDATVFVKTLAVTPAAVSTVKQRFPSEVYSITPGGEVAATSTGIYQVSTGSKLYSLPVTATAQAITYDYSRLVLFNTSTASFQFIDLYAAIGPTVMGRTLGPANGSIVLSPAQLQWSSLPGVNSYNVYLGTSLSAVTAANTASPQYLGLVNTPAYTLTETLAAGVTYYWRVDAVTSAGVTLGNVYSFTVSPISASVSSITAATVQGHSNYTTTVVLNANTAGTLWQATADQPWVTFAQSSGVTPANLQVILNASALPAGIQTATVTISSGGIAVFTVPVTLTVDHLALTIIKSDPLSKYVYAISEDTTVLSPRAYLLEIDSQAQGITRVVPAGSSATDLAIHNPENRIYVPNWASGSLLAFDKTSFGQLRAYSFTPYPSTSDTGDVYRVSAGAAGRVVVEPEDQWVNLSIYNTGTAAILAASSQREGGGAFDPTGRYYYHGDDNISNAAIHKFDLNGDAFTQLTQIRVQSYSYYGTRTVVASSSGNRVFWNGSCFDANLVELWTMGQEVYSSSPDGRYAFGSSQIYDTVLKQAILGMPVTTQVSAFNAISKNLVVQMGTALAFFPINTPITLRTPVLSSGTVTSSAVALTWTDNSLETGFDLQYQLQGASTWTDASPAPAQNTTSATVSGLTGNSIYNFRILAASPAANSGWSNIVTVTTPPTPPATPYLGTLTATAKTVTLGWSEAIGGTSFIVERSLDGLTNWSAVATPAAGTFSYVDSAVNPQTRYYYRIRAALGSLFSSYSSVSSITTLILPAAPSAPPFILTGANSSSSVAVYWVGSTGASSYAVERSMNGTIWNVAATTPSGQTYYTDTGLTANTWYEYRIRAVNDGGTSAPSSTSLIVTWKQIDEWRFANFGSSSTSGPAASTAMGADGITNLIKFASNMNPTDGVTFLAPGTGASGLPSVSIDPATQCLRVEFMRRKAANNPAITYQVQFAGDLGGFAPCGAALQVTSVDPIWERVVWEDSVNCTQCAHRFARVAVTEVP